MCGSPFYFQVILSRQGMFTLLPPGVEGGERELFPLPLSPDGVKNGSDPFRTSRRSVAPFSLHFRIEGRDRKELMRPPYSFVEGSLFWIGRISCFLVSQENSYSDSFR